MARLESIVHSGHRAPRYPADLPLARDGRGAAELAHLQAEKAARLARLARRLAGHGIGLAAGLAGPDPRPLLAALDACADAAWGDGKRAWDSGARFAATRWPARDAGDFTLVTDLGIALGELAIARGGGRWAWGVDGYDEHAADGDGCFGQVAVLDPALPPDARDPPVAWPLGVALTRYDLGRSGPRFAEGLRSLLWFSDRALYTATAPP
jgi:hypothetical protein